MAERDEADGILRVIPGSALALCVKLLVGAAGLYLILQFLGFQSLFRDDGEGVGALLQIIGTLYRVLYAFATYVIWGQFTAVENEILKESGALKDLLLFSRPLGENAREPIVRAVKFYARVVVESEWRALSNREGTDRSDRAFHEVITAVTEIKPEGETSRSVFERLLDLANQASAHRDERLALSVKRMPRTLLVFVTLTASTILFLLFFFPFRNVGLGVVSIVLTTALLYFAYFVLTDLDNPFEGTWNVTAAPFEELLSKMR